MIRSRAVLAIILVALGLVWVGQGTGLLKGSSFMVGDPTWTAIGALLVVVGLAVAAVELKRRRRA
jgi:predicted Co/Zn/Cd cation transporter (cation efflux family)